MQLSNDKIRLMDVARAALRLLPSAGQSLWATLKVYALTQQSKQSIGQLLEQQAQKSPGRDCLLFEGLRWNYADFNAWVNRIAEVLQRHGVLPGDKVGLLFENCPELLACVAAITKIGAVAGMLNPNQRGTALKYSINAIQPKTLLIGEGCLASLYTAHPERPPGMLWFWVGSGQAQNGMISLSQACETAATTNPSCTGRVRAGDPCFLIFTSGTTGMPKAAVMTHLRWLRCGLGMGQAAMRLRADDVFYCTLPFYHNSALTLCWSSVLASGATLAMARKFSASGFWRDIRSTGATAFVYIGELCQYLLTQAGSRQDREHRVRVVIGNGLRPEIWDEFQQRFGIKHICEFYGSSEGNLVFVNAFGLPRTAGFTPNPYAIVAFDSDNECPQRFSDGFMRRVSVGAVGLLITEVSEANPFDGYTDAAATEAKLLRDVFGRGDVWINSGDVVRDQGLHHIAFVDRLGDTFRWKGENVATTEVERACDAITGVAQVSVYGVRVPHTDGRAAMAAIVMQSGERFDGVATARALIEALPAYAIPLFVRIMKHQETTDTFKVRKVELKKQGFDPASITEPLFVLLNRDSGYEVLTEPTHRRILAGALKL
jgi:acyl-CoA synthetase (AMP-forming)/AMP-acid ligase II